MLGFGKKKKIEYLHGRNPYAAFVFHELAQGITKVQNNASSEDVLVQAPVRSVIDDDFDKTLRALKNIDPATVAANIVMANFEIAQATCDKALRVMGSQVDPEAMKFVAAGAAIGNIRRIVFGWAPAFGGNSASSTLSETKRLISISLNSGRKFSDPNFHDAYFVIFDAFHKGLP